LLLLQLLQCQQVQLLCQQVQLLSWHLVHCLAAALLQAAPVQHLDW
jgi:hypothetical protein